VQEKSLGSEFQSEVQTLSRVEHLNLVKFYGYLEQGDERIIVVEYVPNGTLREHLDCEFFWPFNYFIPLLFALAFWLFHAYNLIKGSSQAFMETFSTLLLV
jgi:serine/threonine protein kinase